MITDTNPFFYSRPIGPEDIIDRDEETAKLLQWAVGGRYLRLYAPRKFGKTSLLGRVLADGASEEGLIPVMVDLYGVLSVADVTIRIERAYAGQLKGALHRKIDSFLKSTGIGLSIGAFGISAKLQISPQTNPCRRCTRCSTFRFGWKSSVASERSSSSTSFRTSTRSRAWMR